MTTIESVCNQALDVIGYPRHIGNIWEGTKASRVALDAWWQTRDGLLTATRPEWARREAVLTQVKAAPANAYGPGVPWTSSYPPIPWLYEYSTPSDCLVPLQIKPTPIGLTVWRPRPTTFRTQGDLTTGAYTILSNISPTILIYIYRVLDPTLWHDDFTEMMVQTLARKFATALGRQAPQEEKNADEA